MYKLLFCLFFIVSCQRPNFSSVDDYVFGMTGGTLFSDPIMVSSKDIHLDSGHLIGQDVVFQGRIVSKGDFETHFVLNDDLGRMIVVLTKLNNKAFKSLVVDDSIKVLGVVERKSKGYPYISAKALNF